MGHKISDGKAVDVTAPAGDYSKGDLFRIAGFTGYAMDTILTADTDRGLALEVTSDAVWSVKLPAGQTPAVADLMYWTGGQGTAVKRGDTDLTTTATGNGLPVVKVVKAKNANGYAQVRLVNAGG